MRINDPILDPFIIYQDYAGFHVKEVTANKQEKVTEVHKTSVPDLGSALGYIGLHLKLRAYDGVTVTLRDFAKFEQDFDMSLKMAFGVHQPNLPLNTGEDNGEQMDITSEEGESITTESAETVDIQSS